MNKIAIVGAGMAGCYLGQRLRGSAQVRLFEKSRGPSGRLATRRGGDFHFDHGAQFFTARSEEFLKYLAPFVKSGLVQGWKPRLVTLGKGKTYKRQWFEPHLVAVPGMSSWLKEVAADLDVQLQCTIARAESLEGRWILHDDQGQQHGPFDLVISTAPAVQTAALFPQLAPRLAGVRMAACYAWMLGFEKRPGPGAWDAAVVQDSPLSWLAWNQSKPGRNSQPALVVHTSNQWAEANLERTAEEVQAELGKALLACAGIDAGQATFSQLHRWRYASTPADLEAPYLLDLPNGLAACGDWCLKGRLEGAFLSAFQLVEHLLTF